MPPATGSPELRAVIFPRTACAPQIRPASGATLTRIAAATSACAVDSVEGNDIRRSSSWCLITVPSYFRYAWEATRLNGLTAPRTVAQSERLDGIQEYALAAPPTLAPNQSSTELAAWRADMWTTLPISTGLPTLSVVPH